MDFRFHEYLSQADFKTMDFRFQEFGVQYVQIFTSLEFSKNRFHEFGVQLEQISRVWSSSQTDCHEYGVQRFDEYRVSI